MPHFDWNPDPEQQQEMERSAGLKVNSFISSMNRLGWHIRYNPSLLFVATERGRWENVQACFEKGVSLDSCHLGENPVHRAAENSKIKILTVFLKYSISLSLDLSVPLKQDDKKGEPQDQIYPGISTPLHVAALGLSFSSVKWLLAHGSNINQQDQSGNTPLHLLLLRKTSLDQWTDQARMVQLLLEHGASLDIRGASSFLPFEMALRSNRGDLAQMIEKKLLKEDPQIQVISHRLSSKNYLSPRL